MLDDVSTSKSGGLGRASVVMASGSLVSRGLGLVRNAMLVACVGSMTGASTAFQTANTLPNFIFQLLSGGILTAILIPQITKAMRRKDGGQDVIDRLLTASFGLVTIVALLATVSAAPLIIAFQLEGAVRDLGILFAYICLPQIFFYGVYAILGQVLNAYDKFAAFMWTPVLANVVQIGGMAIFLSQYVGAEPAEAWTPGMIWLLAGTSTAGIAVQALGLLPSLRKVGFTFTPRWGWRGYGFGSAAKVAMWSIVAVLVAQFGGLVTQAIINVVSEKARLAGFAVPGIMIYTLAYQIFMVPHSIVTTSILTALYPRMSRSVQAHDIEAMRADTMHGLTLPATMMIPISFAAVVLAVPGMRVINPTMDPAGVEATALAFSLMAIGFYSYGLQALQQRYSLSREDGRSNLIFQVVVTVFQLLFGVGALFVPAQFGVATIAVGQTVGNTVAGIAFVVVAHRQIQLPIKTLLGLLGKLVVGSIPAALVSWWTVRSVATMMAASWLGALAQLAAGGVVFVVVFLVTAVILRIPAVMDLLSRVRR